MRQLFSAVLLCIAIAHAPPAQAEPASGFATIEAVSIGPRVPQTDIFFEARFSDRIDGRAPGETIWLRVRESVFGPAGVDRVQRLLTAGLMGRNRMVILYETDRDELIGIRLEK